MATFHAVKKDATKPLNVLNISTTSNEIFFLNKSSKVTTTFPHQCQFTCRPEENAVNSIRDILKCTHGQFNVSCQIA